MFENVCDFFELCHPSQVRVATEGINGTVGGTDVAARLYIEAMCSHPVFRMDREDFKVCQAKQNISDGRNGALITAGVIFTRRSCD